MLTFLFLVVFKLKNPPDLLPPLCANYLQLRVLIFDHCVFHVLFSPLERYIFTIISDSVSIINHIKWHFIHIQCFLNMYVCIHTHTQHFFKCIYAILTDQGSQQQKSENQNNINKYLKVHTCRRGCNLMSDPLLCILKVPASALGMSH